MLTTCSQHLNDIRRHCVSILFKKSSGIVRHLDEENISYLHAHVFRHLRKMRAADFHPKHFCMYIVARRIVPKLFVTEGICATDICMKVHFARKFEETSYLSSIVLYTERRFNLSCLCITIRMNIGIEFIYEEIATVRIFMS